MQQYDCETRAKPAILDLKKWMSFVFTSQANGSFIFDLTTRFFSRQSKSPHENPHAKFAKWLSGAASSLPNGFNSSDKNYFANATMLH